MWENNTISFSFLSTCQGCFEDLLSSGPVTCLGSFRKHTRDRWKEGEFWTTQCGSMLIWQGHSLNHSIFYWMKIYLQKLYKAHDKTLSHFRWASEDPTGMETCFNLQQTSEISSDITKAIGGFIYLKCIFSSMLFRIWHYILHYRK